MSLAAWVRAEHASFVAASIWEAKSLRVSRCNYLISSIPGRGFCLVSAWRGRNMWRQVLGHCKQTQLWPASCTNCPAFGSQRARGIVWLPGWLFWSVHLSGGDKQWKLLLRSLELRELWGFILLRAVLSELSPISQAKLIHIIQPILTSNPHPHYIRFHWGCSSEQLYSSSDAVGAPQIYLWG